MKTSETISKISPAMMKASAEIQNMATTREGYGYRYLELPAIIEAVKPVLFNNGLFVIQSVTSEDSTKVGITTRLTHSSGEFFEDTFYLPPTNIGKANEVQKLGSSITYGRRYGLSTILLLAVDDDVDANDNTPTKTTKTNVEKLKTYIAPGTQNRKVLESLPGAIEKIEKALTSNVNSDIIKMIDTVETKQGITIIV